MTLSSDCVGFRDFYLDDRIYKAIEKLGWSKPTLIQQEGITLGLNGKDIVARARTGSGKTATYLIPIISHILKLKPSSPLSVKCLILVPTKELCEQVYQQTCALLKYCGTEVTLLALSSSVSLSAQKPGLLEKPDIVIATPSRALAHLKSKNLNLKKLAQIVVDEADLLFSFGYEEDVRALCSHFPSTVQSFLMSATFSQDVDKLKDLLSKSPVVVNLKESYLPKDTYLRQHIVRCVDKDRFLLLYALLAFKIVMGKIIIFVNCVNTCYKLKLFLDAFSIKSCVLNSSLPFNSRLYIVEEFNRGKYDIIIASDENLLIKNRNIPQTLDMNNQIESETEFLNYEKKELSVEESRKNSLRSNKDGEYTMSRGIDFLDVEWVINFDFPTHANAYIHRVGRTARAGKHGNSLSFLSKEEDKEVLNNIETLLNAHEGGVLQPYKFPFAKVERLRYRVEGVLTRLTRGKIKASRLLAIKNEILTSSKLKTHFEEHPRELRILKHTRPIDKNNVDISLKNVPSYLRLQKEDITREKTVLVNEHAPQKRYSFWNLMGNTKKIKKGPYSNGKKSKSSDPLKTFSLTRKK